MDSSRSVQTATVTLFTDPVYWSVNGFVEDRRYMNLLAACFCT